MLVSPPRCGPRRAPPAGACRRLRRPCPSPLSESRAASLSESPWRPRTRYPPPLKRHTPGREGVGAIQYFHLSSNASAPVVGFPARSRSTMAPNSSRRRWMRGATRTTSGSTSSDRADPPRTATWRASTASFETSVSMLSYSQTYLMPGRNSKLGSRDYNENRPHSTSGRPRRNRTRLNGGITERTSGTRALRAPSPSRVR